MQRDVRSEQPARIVVGVDGSPASLEALTWAAAYATITDAVLEIVHTRFTRAVANKLIEGAEEEERSILDRATARAHELAPIIHITGLLEDPPAAKKLIDASEGARLLVVGSRGFGGFKELTLGSVSQQCVHHAHCPVVVIRPQTGSSS